MQFFRYAHDGVPHHMDRRIDIFGIEKKRHLFFGVFRFLHQIKINRTFVQSQNKDMGAK